MEPSGVGSTEPRESGGRGVAAAGSGTSGVGSTEPRESGGRGVAAAGSGTTSRSSFEPAGAGALLGGVTVAAVGAGALIGWAAGSVGLGILAGAFVGLPAGVFAVYRRYRNAF